MRIITWNCARGFANKANLLFAKDPDIAIVQECLEPHAQQGEHSPYQSQWFGEKGSIGVAVFYKSPWQLTLLSDPTFKWVVPFRVSGPEHFNLIAVWSCPQSSGSSKYVDLVRSAVNTNLAWFSDGPVVVAGDFNSNSQWDKPAKMPHASLVARLEELGLVSAFHRLKGSLQGEEKEDTFHMHRKEQNGFHIDYIFVPPSWLESNATLEVGAFAEWGAQSDHRPLILEVFAAPEPRT